MVKSYLRFEQESTFGVIASNSNIVWLPPKSNSTSSANSSGGRALVGGLEDVLTWDVKTGSLLSRWNEGSDNPSSGSSSVAEVTSIAEYQGQMVASGYSNGVIKVWDSLSGTLVVLFNGHKSAVSVLKFDSTGTRLASGSRDSNIILWDLVGEVGLYRLRSHRDQVVALEFLRGKSKIQGDDGEEIETEDEEENWLLSAGKDGLIKLWDLEAQHCIETHVAHRGETWSMGWSSEHNVAVTGSTSKELKFWAVDVNRKDGERVKDIGTILKQSGERAHTIKFHRDGRYFLVGNADRSIEIFRIRLDDEVKKSVARKMKRRREKGLDVAEGGEYTISEDDVIEKYISYTVIRTPAKVRSLDWAATNNNNTISLVASLTNNSIESFSISAPLNAKVKKSAGPAEYNRQYSVELAGHRADIRALSISSDERMVASASNGSLKVWNVRTHNCIRTFECGYALCASFLPGDALIVVGTKAGEIELYDVASSSLIDKLPAHEGSVWSLHVGFDGKTVVTGGADKSVKFWEIKVVEEEVLGTTRKVSRMRLKHTRTLELSDDVLSVRLSPDMKLVTASLLDNTVKVFFTDTLKFFLSLYGHKLPVLAMDISYDSKLLVTCSADKNIKIWGLDFGDCHRSIFAHQDSIMSVVFEPETHNLFSVGKDKLVKYWDGDKFENIQKLEGHQSEIWALAIAGSGDFIVTGSHDRSIRVWARTDEPLFLEEEREKELEELYENNLTSSFDDDGNSLGPLQHGQGDDLEDTEMMTHDDETHVGRAGKQTIETLKAGERLMEALDIGKADLELQREYKETLKKNPKAAMPTRNVILAALDVSAEKYVMDVTNRIRAAQLEDALLVLPFDKVISLFVFIDLWAQHRWNIPLVSRVLSTSLQIHHRQIVANQVMRPTLESLRNALRSGLELHKNQIGYNIAGLKFLKQNWELHHKKEFIDETLQREEEDRLTKKRTFTNAVV